MVDGPRKTDLSNHLIHPYSRENLLVPEVRTHCINNIYCLDHAVTSCSGNGSLIDQCKCTQMTDLRSDDRVARTFATNVALRSLRGTRLDDRRQNEAVAHAFDAANVPSGPAYLQKLKILSECSLRAQSERRPSFVTE